MAARWEVPRFSHKLSGQGRTYTDVALVFFVGWVRYPDHQVGLVRTTHTGITGFGVAAVAPWQNKPLTCGLWLVQLKTVTRYQVLS